MRCAECGRQLVVGDIAVITCREGSPSFILCWDCMAVCPTCGRTVPRRSLVTMTLAGDTTVYCRACVPDVQVTVQKTGWEELWHYPGATVHGMSIDIAVPSASRMDGMTLEEAIEWVARHSGIGTDKSRSIAERLLRGVFEHK